MQKTIIIAGSGVSVDSPSNLPSWWDYNRVLMDEIKSLALEQCPDSAKLLKALDIENSLPVQCLSDVIVSEGAGYSYFPLLKLLDGTIPNANHLAMQDLAKRGMLDAIVTTNYDSLIEAAFSSEYVPLTVFWRDEDYREAPTTVGCKLLKIHGNPIDESSLIDTVTQKSRGLSQTKRLALNGLFERSNLIVMGFSGADLDFGDDYIPIMRAIETGGTVTWICRPGSQPNPNVLRLAGEASTGFTIIEQSLGDFFKEHGVEYDMYRERAAKLKPEHTGNSNWDSARSQIRALFEQPHLGRHACVGYCLSLLEMIGCHTEARELADQYERTIGKNAVRILSVDDLMRNGFLGNGLMALARLRASEGEFARARELLAIVIRHTKALDAFNDRLDEANAHDVGQRRETRKRECASNMAAAYLNKALYAEKDGDAEAFWEDIREAEEFAGQSHSQKLMGLVAFAKARVKYAEDGDYDDYLVSLRHCESVMRASGGMRELAEILLADCKTRLVIGEYAIARDRLHECGRVLRNVGSINLRFQCSQLQVELMLRENEKEDALACCGALVDEIVKAGSKMWAAKMMEMIVSVFQSEDKTYALLEKLAAVLDLRLPNPSDFEGLFDEVRDESGLSLPKWICLRLPEDLLRIGLIVYEYAKDTEKCLEVLHVLCNRYSQSGKWERLIEMATCLQSIEKPDAKIEAAYHMGCAYADLGRFEEAVTSFGEIIEQNDAKDSLYVGFAYIELAKVFIANGDDETAYDHYSRGKESIPASEHPSELVNACGTFILSLARQGKLDEALAEAQILKDSRSDDYKERIESLIGEIEWIKSHEAACSCGDIEAEMPEVLANRALSLYKTEGDFPRAQELLLAAKRKYGERGDEIGAAKCEDNLGMLSSWEKRFDEAKGHYVESMRIRDGVGDTAGFVAQLANIINLCRAGLDVSEFVDFAEQHLPEYESYPEKAQLYASMFIYYTHEVQIEKAYTYGTHALKYRMYLDKVYGDTDLLDKIDTVVRLVEEAYEVVERPRVPVSKFDESLNEVTRLFHVGQYDKSHELLDKLAKDAADDPVALGKIEGTRGNAHLDEGRYLDATEDFRRAIEQFELVGDDGNAVRGFKLAAINGLVLALDGSGHQDEVMTKLAEVLPVYKAYPEAFPLAISYVNRVIQRAGAIEQDGEIFNAIFELLSEVEDAASLNHEMRGTLHHAYGLLYCAASDYHEAQRRFEKARREFVKSNSRTKLTASEAMLKEVGRSLENCE